MHHTKDKGDLGVFYVQLDLAKRGWMILHPQTEHAPFDFAIYKNGKFLRIQSKYKKITRGRLELSFRRSWSDKNGCHCEYLDMTAVDYFAIYCPDTDSCYYIKATPKLKTKAISVGNLPGYKAFMDT